MFRYFAENIAFLLIKHKMLDIKNRDVYTYGIEVILSNVILIFSFLGISLVANCLIVFIGFLLFFIPIRSFAGGYHAKHSETCFGISVGVYVTAMIIYNQFPNLYKNAIVLCVFIMAIIILLIWSPLKNPNHPLAAYQYERNRKIVYGIIVLNIVLFIVFAKMNNTIASCEEIFVIFTSIFLIIGKWKNGKARKNILKCMSNRSIS